MIYRIVNVEKFFMFYKDNDIDSLKDSHNGLQDNLERIVNYKKNYICTCVLRSVDIDFALDKMKFIAFVEDINRDKLCCNCHYVLIANSNNAAGENPADHYHPRFAEELLLITIKIVHRAILALEYGLKELTDDEIDVLCREYPDVGIESARDFNSYFNDLEL